MDCAVVDLALYHFGALEGRAREDVEEHLVGCTGCLRTYLALKRKSEVGTAGEVPSEAARMRLRAAVAKRFAPSPVGRVRAFFGRPIPLYQGLAAAVFALVAASLIPMIVTNAPDRPIPREGRNVDTARPHPESLTIY